MALAMKELHPRVDIAGPFVFRLYPGSPIYNRIVQQYDLKLPESLHEWSDYIKKSDSFTDMPWTPSEFRSIIRFLPFYTDQAFQYTGIVNGAAKYRLKYFDFRWPVEYWAWKIKHQKL